MSWRLRWNVLASHIRTGRWISLRLLTGTVVELNLTFSKFVGRPSRLYPCAGQRGPLCSYVFGGPSMIEQVMGDEEHKRRPRYPLTPIKFDTIPPNPQRSAGLNPTLASWTRMHVKRAGERRRKDESR
jgi:hypothetical protein